MCILQFPYPFSSIKIASGATTTVTADNIRSAFQVERDAPHLHVRVDATRCDEPQSTSASNGGAKSKEFKSVSSVLWPKAKGDGEGGEGSPPAHKRQRSADAIDSLASRVRPSAVRSASSSVSGNGYHHAHSHSHGTHAARSSRKMASPRAHASGYAARPAMTSHPDSPHLSSLASPKPKSRHQHRRSEPPPPDAVRRNSAGSGGLQKKQRPKSQHGVSPKAPIIMPIPSDHPYHEHYAQDVDDDDNMSVVDLPISSPGGRGGNGPATRPRQRRRRPQESDQRRQRNSKTAPRRKGGRSPRTPPSPGAGDSAGSRSHSRSGGNASGSSGNRHRRSSAPRRAGDKQAKVGDNGSRSHSRVSDSSRSNSDSGHEQKVCVVVVTFYGDLFS